MRSCEWLYVILIRAIILQVAEAEEIAMISGQLCSKFLFSVGLHTKKTLRGPASEWYDALQVRNFQGYFGHVSHGMKVREVSTADERRVCVELSQSGDLLFFQNNLVLLELVCQVMNVSILNVFLMI